MMKTFLKLPANEVWIDPDEISEIKKVGKFMPGVPGRESPACAVILKNGNKYDIPLTASDLIKEFDRQLAENNPN